MRPLQAGVRSAGVVKEPATMHDESHDIQSRNPMRALPVPDALHGCTDTEQSHEHTWPAYDLSWFTG